MNKIKSLTVIIFVFVFIFGACKKYDEGPTLSLRSKTDRLKGEWLCQGIYKNGEIIDTLETYANSYVLQFYADGNGISFYGPWSFYFTWSFSNKKESILWLMSEEGATSNEMEIRKLTHDDFWFLSSTDNYEYRMIKNNDNKSLFLESEK